MQLLQSEMIKIKKHPPINKDEDEGGEEETKTRMDEPLIDQEVQTHSFSSSLLLNLYIGHFLARWGARFLYFLDPFLSILMFSC